MATYDMRQSWSDSSHDVRSAPAKHGMNINVYNFQVCYNQTQNVVLVCTLTFVLHVYAYEQVMTIVVNFLYWQPATFLSLIGSFCYLRSNEVIRSHKYKQTGILYTIDFTSGANW